ncbi:MAG: hypothetical protein ACO1SV_15510 [Fimbriimonas sp.]
MSLHDDLKAYLDGELPAERMAEMREAIDRDPMLAQEAEALSGISGAIKMAAAQPSSVGLEETLKALSRRERRPWWPWLAPLVVGAAALWFVVLPIRQTSRTGMAPGGTVAMQSKASSEGSVTSSSPRADFDMVAPKSEVRFRENAVTSMDRSVDGNARSHTKSGGARKAETLAKVQGNHVPAREKTVDGRNPAGAVPKAAGPRPNGSPDWARTGAPEGLKEPAERPGQPQLPVVSLGTRAGVEVAEVETEPIVIEVESVEEAETALRDLAAQLGGEVKPAATLKGETADAPSTTAEKAQLRSAVPDRRVVLEVDDDRVAEARKRVPDAVREARLRRENQQYANRALGGAQGRGDFGGGSGQGPSRAQGDATQNAGHQRQGPTPTQNPAQNMPNPPAPRQGGGRDQGAVVGAQFDQSNQKRARGGNVTKDVAKPRRRLQIILKVKPKAPGKLEE